MFHFAALKGRQRSPMPNLYNTCRYWFLWSPQREMPLHSGIFDVGELLLKPTFDKNTVQHAHCNNRYIPSMFKFVAMWTPPLLTPILSIHPLRRNNIVPYHPSAARPWVIMPRSPEIFNMKSPRSAQDSFTLYEEVPNFLKFIESCTHFTWHIYSDNLEIVERHIWVVNQSPHAIRAVFQ